MKFVVLLRGVNVGGVKVKMAELREALEAAGFASVKTILASGNVLVQSDLSAAKVKALCEQVLTDTFGYEAWVIVLQLDALAEIVDGYPFDPEREGWQPYVIFSSDGTSTKELTKEADGTDPAVEQVQAGKHHVLYWEVERGQTLHSHIGKTSSRARYKSTTTTRNLRTLQKLLA
jgi:uncharacterized protein (DUF1697 family)